MALRVVGNGCDSLYYTAGRLPATVLEELARDKERAATEDVVRVLNGYPFSVASHGGEGGWRFVLNCQDKDGATLYTVCATDAERSEQARVQIHSYALWSLGAWRAYRESCVAVAALYNADPDKFGGKISRLDLCADFQGWDLSEGIDESRIVSSARNVYPWAKYGACACGMPLIENAAGCPYCWTRYTPSPTRALTPAGRRRARAEAPRGVVEPARMFKLRKIGFKAGPATEVFTGWTWGSGKKISLRIYNKTHEIKTVSKKHWFEIIWRKCPEYVPGEVVWRVEPQLNRELFNDIRVGSDRHRIDAVEAALRDAQSLWYYVLGGRNPRCMFMRTDGRVCFQGNETWRSRCVACGERLPESRGWFSLREPRGVDVDRWSVDPRWRALQLCEFDGAQPVAECARVGFVAGQASTLMRMGAGVVRSLAVGRGALTKLTERYERHRACLDVCAFGDDAACTHGERLHATRVFDEGVHVLREQAVKEGLFDETGDRKGRTFLAKARAQEKKRRELASLEDGRARDEFTRAEAERLRREIVPLHQRPSKEPRSVSAIRYGWRPQEDVAGKPLTCTCGHSLDVHEGITNACTSCGCDAFFEVTNYGDERRREAERAARERAGTGGWGEAQARAPARQSQTGFTFDAAGRLQWPQRAPGDDGGDEPA